MTKQYFSNERYDWFSEFVGYCLSKKKSERIYYSASAMKIQFSRQLKIEGREDKIIKEIMNVDNKVIESGFRERGYEVKNCGCNHSIKL